MLSRDEWKGQALPRRARLVGCYEPRNPGRGWFQPGSFSVFQPLYELDAEPSAEDSAILQKLMNAGHADRLEFLG